MNRLMKEDLVRIVGLVMILNLVLPVWASEPSAAGTDGSVGALRELVAKEIEIAKRKGVGTKPYEKALADIDVDVTGGIAADQLRKRLDSLLNNLKNQNREAALIKKGGARGTLTKDEVTWGPFRSIMHELQWKIKGNWHPMTWEKSKRLSVSFGLLRTGQIQNLQLENSSGDDAADEIALEAVRKSVPFRPIPANLKVGNDVLCIQFTFDYNVFRSRE